MQSKSYLDEDPSLDPRWQAFAREYAAKDAPARQAIRESLAIQDRADFEKVWKVLGPGLEAAQAKPFGMKGISISEKLEPASAQEPTAQSLALIPVAIKVFSVLAVLGLVALIWPGSSKDRSGDQKAQKEAITPHPGTPDPPPAQLGPFTPQDVCRGAIATIFRRDLRIIMVRESSKPGIYETWYRRQSDGSLWQQKCQLHGSRVRWGSRGEGSSGRWRDHPADGKLYFRVDGDQLSVEERIPGEGIVTSYIFALEDFRAR